MSQRTLPKSTPLFIMGLALIALGVVAMATPAIAGKAVVIIIGVMMTAAGLLQLFTGYRSEGWSSRLPPMILGIITLLCGLAFLGEPWIGLQFITLILAIAFAVEGIWKIVASFSYRPASGWFAVLGSGLVSLLLGYLIYAQWPSSELWAVGILVGANLLITGVALLAVAVTVRRLKDLFEEKPSEEEESGAEAES